MGLVLWVRWAVFRFLPCLVSRDDESFSEKRCVGYGDVPEARYAKTVFQEKRWKQTEGGIVWPVGKDGSFTFWDIGSGPEVPAIFLYNLKANRNRTRKKRFCDIQYIDKLFRSNEISIALEKTVLIFRLPAFWRFVFFSPTIDPLK